MYNACNSHPQAVVVDHRSSYHLVDRDIAKILPGPLLGQHYLERLVQRCCIPSQPLIPEYIEISGRGNDSGARKATGDPVPKFFEGIIPIRDAHTPSVMMKSSLRFKCRHLVLKTRL